MLKVKGLVLAAALLVASSIPAAAQDLGVGVSFLGDSGGTGVVVDYSGPLQKHAGDYQLNWVGDLSFHHKGESGFGISVSRNVILAEGGVRIKGKLADKASWHAQGLVGVMRSSFSENLGICSLASAFGEGCSDTSVIVTPGGAINYDLSDTAAVRAQLDIPIGSDGNTTRFSLMYILKMGGK